jgi:hypothetical protein
MTDKDLKKLNRQDLLILLAEQTARANALEEKLRVAEEQLTSRNLSINESGTLAEAALKLSGIFQAADEAVASYFEKIKRLNDRQTLVCQEMETASKQKADMLIQDAERKAATIIQSANELAAKEIERMNAHWDDIQRKIQELDKEYSWLRGILQRPSGDLR